MEDESKNTELLKAVDTAISGALDLHNEVEALQRRVSAITNSKTSKVADLAAYFYGLRRLYEHLDDLAKSSYHLADSFNKSILPAAMEEEGLSSIRVPELGRTFTVVDKMSASFMDKELGFEWLRSIGQGALITETVHAGTLSSFVRSLQLEQGIDPPEDVVKVGHYKSIVVTKYNKK